jgi:chemotaxis protein methyltransferase CheR
MIGDGEAELPANFDIELPLLLDAIYMKYHYDFRGYARATLRRRLHGALARFSCQSLSQLQDRLLHEPTVFPELLDLLTVQLSEMFRDPSYWAALRTLVVPVLRTYPSLKLWVAGCSSGEEAYSLAILLHEEGLYDRSIVYATDINPAALDRAQAGWYEIDRMAGFSASYQQAGGVGSFSEYYTAAYGGAVLQKDLRRNIVFSDHSLATDSVFAEVQLVSCRNVLIYFDGELQTRALGLFHEALCRRGFLGLGAKESLRFLPKARAFSQLAAPERLFQKEGE